MSTNGKWEKKERNMIVPCGNVNTAKLKGTKRDAKQHRPYHDSKTRSGVLLPANFQGVPGADFPTKCGGYEGGRNPRGYLIC